MTRLSAYIAYYFLFVLISIIRHRVSKTMIVSFVVISTFIFILWIGIIFVFVVTILIIVEGSIVWWVIAVIVVSCLGWMWHTVVIGILVESLIFVDELIEIFITIWIHAYLHKSILWLFKSYPHHKRLYYLTLFDFYIHNHSILAFWTLFPSLFNIPNVWRKRLRPSTVWKFWAS